MHPFPAIAIALLAVPLVAQDAKSPPLRYTLKEGTKLYSVYENSWTSASPKAESRLQLWTELKVGKVKGEVADASLTILRIKAAVVMATGKEDYDSDAGGKKGHLGQTGYPADLHDLVGKPFQLNVDTRGRFSNVKLGDASKEVREVLGGTSMDAFFGLCLVTLPQNPVAQGAKWTDPLELNLAHSGKLNLEVTTELQGDAKSAHLGQTFAAKSPGALELKPEAKAAAELAAGELKTRSLELPCKGPLEVSGQKLNVELVLRVSRTEPPAPKSAKKPKG